MLPKNRPPIPPGEILKEEYLDESGMTQAELAEKMGVSVQTVNLIVNGKRAITPETAIALSKVLATSPEMWLRMQSDVDLYHAFQKVKPQATKRVPRRVAARHGKVG